MIFIIKTKNIDDIDDIDVNEALVSKKETHYLNTLVGIMIMMLLNHYIYVFCKRLATLINLIKIN